MNQVMNADIMFSDTKIGTTSLIATEYLMVPYAPKLGMVKLVLNYI